MADEYDAISNEFINPTDDTAWNTILAAPENKDGNSSSGDPSGRRGDHISSNEISLLKGFWSCVKALAGGTEVLSSGTVRSYITGVTSLSLADHTSGYNIQNNISFDHSVTGLCGLSKEDVEAALDIIYNKHDPTGSDNAAKQDAGLDEMVKYFNGYHFCNYQKVDSVFNTDTSLYHLSVNNNTGSCFCFITTMLLLLILHI